jgi:hypothetical protein
VISLSVPMPPTSPLPRLASRSQPRTCSSSNEESPTNDLRGRRKEFQEKKEEKKKEAAADEDAGDEGAKEEDIGEDRRRERPESHGYR